MKALLTVSSILFSSSISLKNPTGYSEVALYANLTSKESIPAPPIAKEIKHYNRYHGLSYPDHYHWLRDDTRNSCKVLSHLYKENKYSSKLMEPLQPLTETIYQEIVKRISEDDVSYPISKGGYEYYTTSVKGLEYPLISRKLKINGGVSDKVESEEILLDLNKFSERQLNLGTAVVSPNHKFLAYSLDTTGGEKYNIFVKNIATGETTLEIKDSGSTLFWSNDNRYIFYITHDLTHRPYRVFRHELGGPSEGDVLLYEEKDPKFSLGLVKSLSEKYLFLSTGKYTATEIHYLDMDTPNLNFTCFSPRMNNRIYNLEHKGDDFLITTNRYLGVNYINNYILKAPISDIRVQGNDSNWLEVTPYDKEHYITGVYPLKDHIVLGERFEGYSHIRVINDHPPLGEAKGRLLNFPEPIFVASVASQFLDYNQPTLFYYYSSMVTTTTLYRFNLTENSSEVLKKDPVGGGFDSKRYKTERLVTDNGVPISIVYRKDQFRMDGTNPLHLYGYGSYGATFDPTFKSSIFSLIDRGFVYAIAHVRGGSAMGRQWYESEGKLLHKKNTFRDFSLAAKLLIKRNYTSSDVLSIEGAPAGGLLVGASINLDPGLYHAAIADVPFFDIINTMMDPSIPLTVIEYEEWGDPNIKEYFDYILSYSPYDNLPENPTKFPHMLVRAGLNDPRVQFWESAKYVAKLRKLLSRSPPTSQRTKILQMVDINSGHFGKSGRYNKYKKIAQSYAFLVATARRLYPFQ